MTGIVAQLRDMRICEGVAGLRCEAADEIERLRAALDQIANTRAKDIWHTRHIACAALEQAVGKSDV